MPHKPNNSLYKMAFWTSQSVIPECLGVCEAILNIFKLLKTTVHVPYIDVHKLIINLISLFRTRIISMQSDN